MPDFPVVLTSAIDGVTEIVAKHINNLEAKVGVDGSAVTSSLDYKVSIVIGWGNHAGLYSLLAHSHSGVYEPVLGNPAGDGYLLKSTALGARSWLDPATYSLSGHTHDYSAVYLGIAAIATDSDKLDGQHGSYYAVAGAAPAAHQLDGTLHTVSGLTAGHFLKALTGTTFGFAAHGLSYGDVGAAPLSHAHAWGDITSGVPTTWTPIAHNLLSAYHGDTTAGSVVRGDLITGQGVSPNTKWVRQAKGTPGHFFKAGDDDVGWAAHGLTYSDVGADVAGAAAAVTPTTLGLVIGINTQAYHANLTSLAGLAFVSASFVKMTGANAFTLDISTYENTANKGILNGYCDLDASVLVPLARIPTTLTGKDADTLDTYHAANLQTFALVNAMLFGG